MPHREHSAGDGCQRILCKVGSGQRGGQTGVLHTDLDGDRAALGGIQLQQLAHTEAGEVAQQVVQDDYGKDQQAAGHDLGGVCRNNGADDEHDGGGGDQRQHADGVLSEGVEEVVDHKAMGTSTTLTMDRNIFTGFTSTRWPAYSRVSRGVRMGASTVETAVIPTDSATSPLDR